LPFEEARPIYKLPLPCQISKAHIRQDFIVGDQNLKAIIMHEKFILIATMPRYEDVF
jgi:hypothetical protein